MSQGTIHSIRVSFELWNAYLQAKFEACILNNVGLHFLHHQIIKFLKALYQRCVL
jgi:hypothetical protein